MMGEYHQLVTWAPLRHGGLSLFRGRLSLFPLQPLEERVAHPSGDPLLPRARVANPSLGPSLWRPDPLRQYPQRGREQIDETPRRHP